MIVPTHQIDMSDHEDTTDITAFIHNDMQEIKSQMRIRTMNCSSCIDRNHKFNSISWEQTRFKKNSVSQDNCSKTSTFPLLDVQKRRQRVTRSYQTRLKGISETLLTLLALVLLQNYFIFETQAAASAVERPKITYNSQNNIQRKQDRPPPSKAICSGDNIQNTGVMSLTYTFSVDWEPKYLPETIIFNIEESLIEALSSRLLSCNQGERIRRHLQHRRNSEGETQYFPDQKTGIIAIGATPEDKISELSTCVPEDESNNCAVVHGTVSLFLEKAADLDLVRYLSRSAIFDSMKDKSTIERTKGVAKLSYLGPSFKKPESIIRNDQTRETKKQTTMATTTILIILGSCSSVTILGTVFFVMKSQRHRHNNMKPVYDFDESQGHQTSEKKRWMNTSQNLTESNDSENDGVQDDSWDDNQEILSVIMEATHEASTRGGSIQVSNAGWTTDEDSTMSYNQTSVVSGFSNLSTYT